MSFKKWIITFITTILIIGTLIGIFNIVVDPFGIFGDKVFNWYEYNMTNNPRIAKVKYLDMHHEKYDSYIIGCSKTSSYSTELLNKYFGNASFYNCIMYGGDMYDIEKTAKYIIDNYKVKNIVINIGLEEAVNYNTEVDAYKNNMHAKVINDSLIKFYWKYMMLNPEYSVDKIKEYINKEYLPNKYTVFDPITGAYNKKVRDIESIVNLEEYLANNPEFKNDSRKETMVSADLAVDAVKRIKEYCELNKINFMLITSPVYEKEIQKYSKEDLVNYWKKLAEVTDFWDFSGYTSISQEPRYFYDTFHFRNSVGNMVFEYIFSNNNEKIVDGFSSTIKYIPKDFGHLTTKANVAEYANDIFSKRELTNLKNYSKEIPILMYHNINEEVKDGDDCTVTPDKFKKDMQTLKDNGYTTVMFKDMYDYVYYGKELPNNPIIITFDDGYLSNYTDAYPVLKELGMKATVSIIGASVGKDTYKDTAQPIKPHFSYEQAREMYESGVMDIQIHSYNMHDAKELEGDDYRIGVLRKKGESEKDYINLFKEDYQLIKTKIEEEVGNDAFVFVYPFGIHDELTEVLLNEVNNKITVTTTKGINTIVKGLPQSLKGMKRINVPNTMASEDLIKTLEGER